MWAENKKRLIDYTKFLYFFFIMSDYVPSGTFWAQIYFPVNNLYFVQNILSCNLGNLGKQKYANLSEV